MSVVRPGGRPVCSPSPSHAPRPPPRAGVEAKATEQRERVRSTSVRAGTDEGGRTIKNLEGRTKKVSRAWVLSFIHATLEVQGWRRSRRGGSPRTGRGNDGRSRAADRVRQPRPRDARPSLGPEGLQRRRQGRARPVPEGESRPATGTESDVSSLRSPTAPCRR